MTENKTYTLTLRDRLSGPLDRITAAWRRVSDQVAAAEGSFAPSPALVRLGGALWNAFEQSAPGQQLEERIGRLAQGAAAALQPLFEMMGRGLGSAVAWLERNREPLLGLVHALAAGVARVGEAVGRAAGFFGGWLDRLRAGSVPVTVATILLGSLAASMALLTLRAKAMALVVGTVTAVKQAWVAVQTALNLSLLASPLTWIVAGVVALIGVVGYLAYATTGWGETWHATWEWIRLSFAQAGAWIEWKWLGVQELFLRGVEVIQKGWYKVQSLWDKESAAEGLASIDAQREARARAIAAAHERVEALAVRRRGLDVWQVRSNGKLGDFVEGLREKLGLVAPPVEPASAGFAPAGFAPAGSTPAGFAPAGGFAGGLSAAAEAPRQVVVQVGSLVENIVFEGGFDAHREELEREVERSLIRVLERVEGGR